MFSCPWNSLISASTPLLGSTWLDWKEEWATDNSGMGHLGSSTMKTCVLSYSTHRIFYFQSPWPQGSARLVPRKESSPRRTQQQFHLGESRGLLHWLRVSGHDYMWTETTRIRGFCKEPPSTSVRAEVNENQEKAGSLRIHLSGAWHAQKSTNLWFKFFL